MNKMILIVLVLVVLVAAGYMYTTNSQPAFTSSSQASGAAIGISQSVDNIANTLADIDNDLG